MPPAIPLIRSGELEALGVTSACRARHMPELRTLQEQGMKGFAVPGRMGNTASARGSGTSCSGSATPSPRA